jgi:hypothetical protein
MFKQRSAKTKPLFIGKRARDRINNIREINRFLPDFQLFEIEHAVDSVLLVVGYALSYPQPSHFTPHLSESLNAQLSTFNFPMAACTGIEPVFRFHKADIQKAQ